MQRRGFLSWLLKSAYAVLGLGCLATLPYLYRGGNEDIKTFFVKTVDEDDLPRRGVKEVEFPFRGLTHKAFIVRKNTDLFVLSPICSHLGCSVNWNFVNNEFDCPCHGGRYDMSGHVIGGPPPKPLTRLPYVIKDGFFYIGIRA